MDIGRVVSLTVTVGVAFYSGFKFNDYLRKRRDLKVYEDGIELLKEELTVMEKKFASLTGDVKKNLKERYEALMKRVDQEMHRPDYIAALLNDVREFIASAKSDKADK